MTDKKFDAELAELPKLTDKQLKFVLAIQEGKTASDAYRECYDCAKSAPKTIWARASELTRNSKVAAWLAHIKAELAELQRLSLEATQAYGDNQRTAGNALMAKSRDHVRKVDQELSLIVNFPCPES